ncbi:MAG: hypothetical protein WC390_10090 [Sulfurimonas sp.]|jgi:hypothetical protein
MDASFKVSQINMAEQVVYIAVNENFCRALGAALKGGSDNPCVQALGHQIAQCGHVLRGADASRWPRLAEVVTGIVDETAPEVETTETVKV